MWATRVADGRGGGQGQVDNAEGHAQAAGGFLRHQLAHAGDFEGGALDELGHLGEVCRRRALSSAARTTPGPETPTLMTQSGSPGPWKAPAIKGLSSGALQNTTSLAAPMQSRSAVRSAVSRTMRPIFSTASMLMPALVVPILTEEQTNSVSASASGMLSIKA